MGISFSVSVYQRKHKFIEMTKVTTELHSEAQSQAKGIGHVSEYIGR